MTPGNPKSPDIPKSREEIITHTFSTLDQVAQEIVNADIEKLRFGLTNDTQMLWNKAKSDLSPDVEASIPIKELIPYLAGDTRMSFPVQYTLEVLRLLKLLPADLIVWNTGSESGYIIDDDEMDFTTRQLRLLSELRLQADADNRLFEQTADADSFQIKVATNSPYLIVEFKIPKSRKGAPILNCADDITFKINTSTASPAGEATKPQPLPVLRKENEGVAGLTQFEEEVLCDEIERIFAGGALLNRNDFGYSICIDSIVARLKDTDGFSALSRRSITRALLISLVEKPEIKRTIISSTPVFQQDLLKILTDLSNDLFESKDQQVLQKFQDLALRIDATYKEVRTIIRNALATRKST